MDISTRVYSLAKLTIFLLIILLPFTHKEAFSVFDPDLVWSKFALGLLALIGAVYIVFDYKRSRPDVFWLLLWLMFFFQIASLIYSKDTISTLRLSAFTLAVNLSYLPIRNWVTRDKSSIDKTVYLYAIGLSLTIVFLISQVILHDFYNIAIGGIWPVPGYPTRFGSSFWDVNHYGAYISSANLLIISWLIYGYRNKPLAIKAIFMAIILSSVYALYMTGSRSATISFFTGLTTLFVILLWRRERSIPSITKRNYINYSIVTVVLIVPLLFIYLLQDPIRSAFLYRSSSFFSHLFLLKVGINFGLKHFLTGVGANAFHASFRSSEWASLYYYIDQAALNLKLPLHNLWLEVFAETGIISFIFFAFFWLLLTTSLYKSYVDTGDVRSVGLLSGIISFLVGGLMYSYKSEFFWVFVLISTAYSFVLNPGLKELGIVGQIREITSVYKSKITLGVGIMFLFVLLYPAIFILQPLSQTDINAINISHPIVVDFFRYILGNYAFVIHGISILTRVFVGLYILILMGLFFRVRESLVMASLAVLLISVFLSAIDLSLHLLNILPALVILLPLAIAISSRFPSRKKSLGLKVLLILSILIVVFVSQNIIHTWKNFRSGYDKNMAELIELAYNRGFMGNAFILIDDTVDVNLLNFYCTDITRENSKYLVDTCSYADANLLNMSNVGDKNMIIVSDEGVKAHLNAVLSKNELLRNSFEYVELNLGRYRLILIERKASAVV